MNDRPLDRTHVYVRRRNDGKYRAEYCFTARRIVKIVTRETLISDHESGRYLVVGVDWLALYGRTA